MKIDLHVHTVFSYRGEIGRKESDSVIRIEELPKVARSVGLDGIIITDHMTMEAGQEVFNQVQVKNPHFLLFRGMEYHSDHGHLLLYGITDDDVCREFGKYGQVQKVIDFVQSRGGIVIPSHPYKEGYTYGLGDKVFNLRGVAALEAINGSLPDHLNAKAQEAAKKLSLPGVGGSDSHYAGHLGLVYTSFEGRISSMEDLLEELRKGRYHAVKA